ncbi:MAG: radical SAM protein [Pseudomonadota bacterium]
MARFALIQNLYTENLGLMSVSAYLQYAGHEARIFIDSRGINAFSEVEKYNPQTLGFSCTTGMHHRAIYFAHHYKQAHPGTISLFGGPHPTFYPEMVNHPDVDYVCIGEGEEAANELGKALDGEGDSTKIQNLWIHKNGYIIKNPVRPLIENLDCLPWPDRTYYDRYPQAKRETSKNFMAGRGCAYKCNFCANHTLMKLYHGKGKWVRFRSAENVIEEIKFVKNHYPLRFVGFSDDILIINRNWLYPFLNLYKKEIGLPFLSTVRANLVDEELVVALKEAGCISTVFGVESGVERIRNNELAKGVKDEHIYEAARLFHKHKIQFGTYNMVGLPGETLEDTVRTVKMNAEIHPDFPWCSILQPYPGTEVRDRIKKRHGEILPVEEISGSYFTDSVINHKDIRAMANLQKFFHLAVRFPFLQPIIFQLIKLPPNPVFQFIYNSCYAWQLMKRSRIKLLTLLKYALVSRNLFSKEKVIGRAPAKYMTGEPLPILKAISHPEDPF